MYIKMSFLITILALISILFYQNCGMNFQKHQTSTGTPKSCNQVKLFNSSAVDGVYNIDPKGDGQSFEVYCDLTSGENPWTLIGNKVTGQFLEPVDIESTVFPTNLNETLSVGNVGALCGETPCITNIKYYEITNDRSFALSFEEPTYTIQGQRDKNMTNMEVSWTTCDQGWGSACFYDRNDDLGWTFYGQTRGGSCAGVAWGWGNALMPSGSVNPDTVHAQMWVQTNN